MGLKAGGPGLNDWRTRMLFGDNAAAEGWAPGRYKPKLNENDPRDAGVFYLKGTSVTGGCVPDLPMPSKVTLMGKGEAKQRAGRYAEAGLVDWDRDTCDGLGDLAYALDGETSADEAAQAQHEAAQRKAEQALSSEERRVLVSLAEGLVELADAGHSEIPSAELCKSAVPVLADLRGEHVTFGKAKAVVTSALKKTGVPGREERGQGGTRRTYYSIGDVCDAADAAAAEGAA